MIRKLFIPAVLAAGLFTGAAEAGVLDDYIARDDGATRWRVKSTEDAGTFEIVTIELVSQRWQGNELSHNIILFRPKKNEFPDLCNLIITGGNASGGRGRTRQYGELIAGQGGLNVAILDSIPNQPMYGGLREDALIAHTFMQYYKTEDKTWPLLLPMTKAAIKALDAIEAVSAQRFDTPIKRFVTSGASKRGWTTWLTACADKKKRIVGIIPLVFDNLNFNAQMKNQLATWGTYSEQIQDYTRLGLQKLGETQKGRELVRIVDPFEYRDRFQKLPKLIINGTNDRYWAQDALNIYWDKIGENKSVLYVPNSGHGLQDGARVLRTAIAFTRRIAANKAQPGLVWQHSDKDGQPTIRVCANEAPKGLRVWTARSKTKDFRESRWTAREITDPKQMQTLTLERPESGFAVSFVEATFAEGGQTFTLSTQVRILEPAKASKPTRRKAALY